MPENPLNLRSALEGLGTSSPPSLLDPYHVADRVYKEKSINIDGYHFTNCAFINCNITLAKANFSFRSCYLQNCTIYFNGNAYRAARLGSMLQNWPELFKVVPEADGAFTIL
jgi:hypothetical protein